MAKKLEVIIGKKYGRLKVIQDAGIQKGRRYVTCLCDCGNIKDMPLCRIKGGKIISCGCYNKEVVKKMMTTHGLSKTKLYGIYRSMKGRCYNKKNADYSNYGGRGICVCDEWLDDYMNFHQWALNNGYSECLSIDRIDVNGNYEPQNCRWVSQKEQCNNLRKNVRIKYQGYEGTISEVAEKLEIPYTTLYMRLFRKRYKNLNGKSKKILCKTCIYSVLCDDKQFCLCEDLFSYTSRIKCSDYENGSPMTEEEYEQAQNNWLSELRRHK